MLKTIITDIKTKNAAKILDSPMAFKELAVITDAMVYGVFKSISMSQGGTTTMCSPTGDGSVVLTDLMLTGDKKAGSLTLQFNDGTNTEIIGVFPLTDAPLAFSISFNGRWQGWKSAWLEAISSAVGNITASVGYYKVGREQSLNYNDWNKRR